MSNDDLRAWIDANAGSIGKFDAMIPYGRQDISQADIAAVVEVLRSTYSLRTHGATF